MTHHISGFIGPTQHLKDQTKELTNAQVIQGSNIDEAMKKLGVVCEGDKDEFDTLGKHRLNESWLGKEY